MPPRAAGPATERGIAWPLGKRLSGLSESCNKVLSVAAVIGRDFQMEELQKVAGMSDDELFAALEEARKAAVRRADGGKDESELPLWSCLLPPDAL